MIEYLIVLVGALAALVLMVWAMQQMLRSTFIGVC